MLKAIVFLLLMASSLADEFKSVLTDLGEVSKREQADAIFAQWGQSALPKLKQCIAGNDQTLRALATYALKHAWNKEAEDLCYSLLTDKHEIVQIYAYNNLMLKAPPAEVAQYCEGLILKLSPVIVSKIFFHLEQERTDLKRIATILKKNKYSAAISSYLERYYSPKLQKITRSLLRSVDKETQVKLLVGLIHQGPGAHETARKFLTAAHPASRDKAAEYFRRYGHAADRKPLYTAFKKEADPYTKAALKAAIVTVNHRKKQFPESPGLEKKLKPFSSYIDALEAIKASPTKGNWDKLNSFLHTEESSEPFYIYGKHPAAKKRQDRIDLQRFLAGYPLSQKEKTWEPAAELMAPVRNYFRQERHSFGYFVTDEGLFFQSYHVGDDTAWYESCTPVVAVGNGIVRLVYAAKESWGGLVVIEHKLNNGTPFCSLYAHLGPLITVQAGDIVHKGQLLATLGRSYTWENGGYGAHIHFGIHQSTWDKGRWVTGYLSQDRYNKGKHHWQNPQEFLRKHSNQAHQKTHK